MSRRELWLPGALAAQFTEAARRAYPIECCGLIEGMREGGAWQALRLHETKNLAENPARQFLIDPQVQFTLLRSLRGSGRTVIGCFHSHPDGAPKPSETDRSEALEDGFVWLIAGGNPGAGFSLAAHEFRSAAGGFTTLKLKT